MPEYYTDSNKKSLWVLTRSEYSDVEETLTCFAAEKDSGYHVGQRVFNPKLQNSNWQPLNGEVKIQDVLIYD